MNTKETVNNLRLMASTIEELEIGNIISCNVSGDQITCHLMNLKLANADGIWVDRGVLNSDWPWEKSFTHNNIKFFSIHTQEEYDKEKSV